MATTKYCPACKIEKPLLEFYKSSKTKDGKYGFCIDSLTGAITYLVRSIA